MMTGQILSGVDPTEAVKYQLLIGFLIAGGAWLLSDGHHACGSASCTQSRINRI
jgi:hypothetical protein